LALDTSFLSWQRWHLQYMSRQLKTDGYLFIKGYDWPKQDKGFMAYVLSMLRWFLWQCAAKSNLTLFQNFVLSSKFLEQASHYGLELVKMPKQLKKVQRGGITFQKKINYEAKLKQRLQDETYVKNAMQRGYKDRLISEAYRAKQKPKLTFPQSLIKNMPATILVLSPHPDDELVGCGGTLHALKKEGAKIYVIQMTEGATSSGLSNERESVMRTERWKEAAAVAEKLGFEQNYWNTDKTFTLVFDKTTIEKLGKTLQLLRPDLIFVPSKDDLHAEHQIAYKLLSAALQNYSNPIRVLQYPVWGKLTAINYAVDVTGYTDSILDAMYHYSTAMKPEDYNARLQTLWTYQSLIFAGDTKHQVEIFKEERHT